jgi:ABC-2 type transport system permease protein
MLNYLYGELYRIAHKKSMYIYFGALAVAYLLLVFVRVGADGAEQVVRDAETLFALLPAAIGGYLFAALYADDLNSRTLTALIGFGMGKATIALSKLVLMVLFGSIVFGMVPLFMTLAYTVFGSSVPAAALGTVYAWALKALLETVAFSALAAIVVYGLQRPTFGMVSYILLSIGLVDQLLSVLFRWDAISGLLPGLDSHLVSGISVRILSGIMAGESMALTILEYMVYVIAAIALSVLAFHKKELEF